MLTGNTAETTEVTEETTAEATEETPLATDETRAGNSAAELELGLLESWASGFFFFFFMFAAFRTVLAFTSRATIAAIPAVFTVTVPAVVFGLEA